MISTVILVSQEKTDYIVLWYFWCPTVSYIVTNPTVQVEVPGVFIT